MIDAATFRLRYPKLAAKSDETIDYWLADAALIVDATWGADQEPATLALAAHGIQAGEQSGGAAIPAGVTRFRSGSMDVAFTEEAANALNSGGHDSTVYGREFLPYLRRNRGGPRLVA